MAGSSSSVEGSDRHGPAIVYSFNELSSITRNFSKDCLLGQGGFGRVYKGRLKNGKVVAVKRLDLSGCQGNTEFLVEVLMLSLLHHPNLVKLIGYCTYGEQRLLVYEYMPLGSLEDHLHDHRRHMEPLDWFTRMRVAAGAAKGLQYLHETAHPPVIFRDLKPSNILLDNGYEAKLSDFGLAKLGPVGEKTHVTTRVMGTQGYCAPEYATSGKLTLQSDIYSFGVVLLELITGRRALDETRLHDQDLVSWARPYFKNQKLFPRLADPRLNGCYPRKALYQALALTAMCLQEKAKHRPPIGEIVPCLVYLSEQSNFQNMLGPRSTQASTSTSSVVMNHPTLPGVAAMVQPRVLFRPIDSPESVQNRDSDNSELQEPMWRRTYRLNRVPMDHDREN